MAASPEHRPHFLLATDLNPASTPHATFAARFADQLGARTTLFHALLPRPIVVGIGAPPDVLQQTQEPEVVRDNLKQVAAKFAASRPVHVAVDEGADARRAILGAAERIDAAMIMLPTHGRTGIERAVLGSTAEQVLRHSRRPVLLVTDRMLDRRPAAGAERGPVVVATDLSPMAIAAHGPAADLAGRLGLTLLLVSVLPNREPPPYGGGAPVAPPPANPRNRIKECARELRQHAAAIGTDVHVEVLALLDDHPAAAIVKAAAEQKAELLVLTTHGRRGIARMLRGSVAEQVVRHSTVPVVCMPAPESE